jgi:hypothetical protein
MMDDLVPAGGGDVRASGVREQQWAVPPPADETLIYPDAAEYGEVTDGRTALRTACFMCTPHAAGSTAADVAEMALATWTEGVRTLEPRILAHAVTSFVRNRLGVALAAQTGVSAEALHQHFTAHRVDPVTIAVAHSRTLRAAREDAERRLVRRGPAGEDLGFDPSAVAQLLRIVVAERTAAKHLDEIVHKTG